jgi:hypothetical protein
MPKRIKPIFTDDLVDQGPTFVDAEFKRIEANIGRLNEKIKYLEANREFCVAQLNQLRHLDV